MTSTTAQVLLIRSAPHWDAWVELAQDIVLEIRLQDPGEASLVSCLALLKHAAREARLLATHEPADPAVLGPHLMAMTEAAILKHQSAYPARELVHELFGLDLYANVPVPAAMPAWPEAVPRELGYLAALGPHIPHFPATEVPGVPGGALGNAGVPDDMPTEEWLVLYRAAAGYANLLGKAMSLGERQLQKFSSEQKLALYQAGVSLTNHPRSNDRDLLEIWNAICVSRLPTAGELRRLAGELLLNPDGSDRVGGKLNLVSALTQHPIVIRRQFTDTDLQLAQTTDCLRALAYAAFLTSEIASYNELRWYENKFALSGGNFFPCAVREMLRPDDLPKLDSTKLIYLVARCGLVEHYDRALAISTTPEQQRLLTDGMICPQLDGELAT